MIEEPEGMDYEEEPEETDDYDLSQYYEEE